jgi:hypothetical protein
MVWGLQGSLILKEGLYGFNVRNGLTIIKMVVKNICTEVHALFSTNGREKCLSMLNMQ